MSNVSLSKLHTAVGPRHVRPGESVTGKVSLAPELGEECISEGGGESAGLTCRICQMIDGFLMGPGSTK